MRSSRLVVLAALALAFIPIDTLASNRSDAALGHLAPPLRFAALLNAPPGESLELDAFRGKTIVLDFWASWCQPCIEGLPHWNELAGALRDRPVVFLAVTADNDATV